MRTIQISPHESYGRLKFVGVAPTTFKASSQVECLCSCGKRKSVKAFRLITGHTRSCGCLRSDTFSEVNSTHREGSASKRSKEYITWVNMVQRCSNPNTKHYRNYGERGITVCHRWSKFENFLEDMGRRPVGCSLDRIDVNAGYSPSNCRWATADQQINNQRKTVYINFDGERVSIAQAARKLNRSYETIRERVISCSRKGKSIINYGSHTLAIPDSTVSHFTEGKLVK